MCAKIAARTARLWADYFDLSGYLNSAEQRISSELAKVDCFSDDGPRRIEGNYDHGLSHQGFLDPLDNLVDEEIWAKLGSNTDHYFAELWEGSAEGKVAHEQIGKLSGQPRSAAVGGAVLLNIAAEGSGAATRAMVLRNATISANGNGTGRNQGATAAGKIYRAVVRVFSGTFTGFTVKLQESSDDGSTDAYADIADMDQAVDAAGVWSIETAAATKAYKRVVIADWNGTSAVVAVTGGVVAGS